MIKRATVCELDHEAERTPAGITRMHGRNRVDRYVADPEGAAHVTTQRLRIWKLERGHPLKGRYNGSTALLGDCLRVESMIRMAVGDKNSVRFPGGAVAREVLQRVGGRRVPGDEGIDQDARSAR